MALDRCGQENLPIFFFFFVYCTNIFNWNDENLQGEFSSVHAAGTCFNTARQFSLV